jgi:hypothetical protein
VTDEQQSDSPSSLTNWLLIVSQILLLVAFANIAEALVLAESFPTFRALAFILGAILLLVCGCIGLRDFKPLLQTPLRIFVCATILVGGFTPAIVALKDWHLLLGGLGFRAAAVLAVGVGAWKLAAVLQARFSPKQDA